MALTREQIAMRLARELRDGYYVNLGIGLPTLVANYVPKGMEVVLQSENGILGTGHYPRNGEEDPDLINAGKETVTVVEGAAFFDSAESFAMIRGGHIDIAVLGRMEVSQKGDLANWMIPGKMVKGMGGAMDLAVGQVRLCGDGALGQGPAEDRQGVFATAHRRACVDYIVTDLCFLRVTERGLVLMELAPGVTVGEVQALTEPAIIVPPEVRTMQV